MNPVAAKLVDELNTLRGQILALEQRVALLESMKGLRLTPRPMTAQEQERAMPKRRKADG